ncbi:hypothetical protein BXY41_11629 [Lacrimispora xylanisolvens]|uniref:Uncharacterized protein n=1 Tax=Lacrimispora xylanisolvens TaxID=384636 RepID=A0A2S6HJD2_9FIRM|nr:hypothetical protein [Hungatella xylanolytica]PPK77491.1 hypothetical protein BXY41_11629 [Hungatella xylanolytica]
MLTIELIMQTIGNDIKTKTAQIILSNLFKSDDTEKLITKAINEICNQVQKIIDDAFMREYIAKTDSISSRISSYILTNDTEMLDELYSDASDMVHQLKRFNSLEGIIAFNSICSLHLIVVKALAEKKSKYYKDLTRLGKEYAQMLISKTPIINEIFSESVSHSRPCDISKPHQSFNGYSIKQDGFKEKYILKLYTYFNDYWKDNAMIYSESEMEIPQFDDQRRLNFLIHSNGGAFLEEATKYPQNKKIFDDFNVKARSERDSYLNMRLDISNKLINTITQACEQYKNL